MGIIDRFFGKKQRPSPGRSRQGPRPLGLAPLSTEEESKWKLAAQKAVPGKEQKTGPRTAPVATTKPIPSPESATAISGAMPAPPTQPPPPLVNVQSDLTPPEYFPTVPPAYGTLPCWRELHALMADLLDLADAEIDSVLSEIVERIKVDPSLSVDDRAGTVDFMIQMSVAKLPHSMASLRPMLEADLKTVIERSQGATAHIILAQLNPKNILEVASLRDLQRFFSDHPGIAEPAALEELWRHQLTPAQFRFSQKVLEKYPSLRSAFDVFQAVPDDVIRYVDQRFFGIPENEFWEELAKMRILRERRSPEPQFQKGFNERFAAFLPGLPDELRKRLGAIPIADFSKWARAVSTTLVEFLDAEVRKAGPSADRQALEKDRWAIAQHVEKGRFAPVAELIEKVRSRAAQPKELAFEIQRRNTRYFSRHPPYWVAIVEVLAKDRDHIIIDGNLTGEGPLGGVPVQRERMNVSDRIKENLKGKDFSSVSDNDIAEKTEKAVQLLGRRLSQSGTFLTLFYEMLQSVRTPGFDEIEMFPRSIRAIQTEDPEIPEGNQAADGRDRRPTEEEIVATFNNLEPILDIYPTLREKGGLETFIYQRFESIRKENLLSSDAWARRKEVAERLNMAISQVLTPWIKQHRENLENMVLKDA